MSDDPSRPAVHQRLGGEGRKVDIILTAENVQALLDGTGVQIPVDEMFTYSDGADDGHEVVEVAITVRGA